MANEQEQARDGNLNYLIQNCSLQKQGQRFGRCKFLGKGIQRG